MIITSEKDCLSAFVSIIIQNFCKNLGLLYTDKSRQYILILNLCNNPKFLRQYCCPTTAFSDVIFDGTIEVYVIKVFTKSQANSLIFFPLLIILCCFCLIRYLPTQTV